MHSWLDETAAEDGTLTEERVTRAWFEKGWGTGGAQVFRDLSPQMIDAKLATGTVEDVEDFILQFHTPLTAGLSDLRVEIVDLMARPGVTVTHWRVHGVHEDELFGVAATGRDVTFEGSTWQRIKDGKVTGGVDHFDFNGLLASLQADD